MREARGEGSVSYERDFFGWTQEQAALVRAGDFSRLDLQNVADEIESLGRRDRRELGRRLEELIIELLKWRCEPGARCGNWRSAIMQQRYQMELLLTDSPSLRAGVSQRVPEAYAHACERVTAELGLLQPDFPVECPFTPAQILDENFLPEDQTP